MSHYLRTVNEGAAAAIQPAAKSLPLPPIGAAVMYTMRPGHGRNGRTKFPALVQAHRDGRQLDLTVIIDAGDFSDETFVAEAGPGAEQHCWEASAPVGGADPAELAALRAEIAELRHIMLGDYEAPSISFIDVLVEFETKLNKRPAPAKKTTKRK